MPEFLPLFTFERYYDASLATGATYTPTATGLFLLGHSEFGYPADNSVHLEVYSSGASAWYNLATSLSNYFGSYLAIGDGANIRVHQNSTAARQVVLMRIG